MLYVSRMFGMLMGHLNVAKSNLEKNISVIERMNTIEEKVTLQQEEEIKKLKEVNQIFFPSLSPLHIIYIYICILYTAYFTSGGS